MQNKYAKKLHESHIKTYYSNYLSIKEIIYFTNIRIYIQLFYFKILFIDPIHNLKTDFHLIIENFLNFGSIIENNDKIFL